jgi:YihY family inner membrane protein
MADPRYPARPGLRTGAFNASEYEAKRQAEGPAKKTSAIKQLVRRIDAYQRRHTWLGFSIGVFKKFGDDQAGYLAALVAYYAFFSLFPLLLVFVTVLGFVLGNNPELQQKIVGSVLAQLPVIGDQIKVGAMKGSGIALAIGVLGALIGGLGVIQALQHGMDEIWDVPRTRRPNFLWSRLRGLILLAVLGVGSLVSTFLSGIGSAGGAFGPALKIGSFAASLALNFGLFLVSFRVLTAAKVRWNDVAPGAALGAVAWAALQSAGTYLVGSKLDSASGAYGIFAIVIGLLSWLYLGAQITFLAAEVNVVRARKLWPRSLQPPLTEAERRALTRAATQQEIRPEEDIRVDFGPRARTGR